MPEDVLTIGILQTDSVREEFVDEFGDYPDMFVRLLSDAAGDSVRFVCFDAQHGDLHATDAEDADNHDEHRDQRARRIAVAPSQLLGSPWR